ncbi:MAG: hypothetical protein ABWX59_06710 [Microbacteriaceae bacterium]
MTRSPETLDVMPILSPGRHRNPKRGACFMEFASYLAGEKWSDHPKCTHAGLAHLARMVNDCTSDSARSRLASHIPSVIGLTTDDKRLDMVLALQAAAAAIPVAFEERQRSLAVGAIVCQSALSRMPATSVIDAESMLEHAFATAPAAERWARAFVSANLRHMPTDMSARHSHMIIQSAVDGIATACVLDPDDRLYSLLTSAIATSRRFVVTETPVVQAAPTRTGARGYAST